MVIRFEPKTAKEMAEKPKEQQPVKPAVETKPIAEPVSEPELPFGKSAPKAKRKKP